MPDLDNSSLTIDSPIKKEAHIFNSVTSKPYQYIHPLKQRNVENIINSLPSSVEQLWVFGSAVTYNHYPWSDLDILVISKHMSDEDIKSIRRSAACSIDLIVKTKDEFNQYCNQFGHCFYDILREGIKYYDRSWF